ncbi:MAG: hypothetical protein J0H68_07990 [Sphingobacteriia bacterium]|nr:hypothetical protein [Sphingobacteriia bacterium]
MANLPTTKLQNSVPSDVAKYAIAAAKEFFNKASPEDLKIFNQASKTLQGKNIQYTHDPSASIRFEKTVGRQQNEALSR